MLPTGSSQGAPLRRLRKISANLTRSEDRNAEAFDISYAVGGRSVFERSRSISQTLGTDTSAKGIRIPTPVCGLVRNDAQKIEQSQKTALLRPSLRGGEADVAIRNPRPQRWEPTLSQGEYGLPRPVCELVSQ